MPESVARTILGNTSWLVAAEVANRALTFLAVTHLARALGEEAMGITSLGFGLFGMMSLVAAGGIEVLATRRVARTTAGFGRLAGTYLAVAWLWVLPAVAVAGLGLWTMGHPPPTTGVALGIAAAALLDPLALRFAFFGRDSMRPVALADLLGAAVWSLGVFACVHDSGDVQLVPALWLAGAVARVSYLLLQARRFGRIEAPRLRAVRAWLGASASVSTGRIARGSLYFVDVLLLGALVPLADVGLYGVASRLPLFLLGVFLLLHRATFPTLARRRGDPEATSRLVSTLLPVIISVGISAAITLGDASAVFLETLFGPPYGAAAAWMAILALRPLLGGVAGLYRNVLWASNDRRVEARVAVVSALVTIGAVAEFGAEFGPAGGAWGMVLGEAILIALYALVSRPHLAPLRPPRSWLLLQGVTVAALLAWTRLPAPEHPWLAMAAAILVGGLGALLPLAMWIPRLLGNLRNKN